MKAQIVAGALLLAGGQALVAEPQPSGASAKVERLIRADGLWDLNRDQFVREFGGMGFRWTSAARDSARSDGKRSELQAFGRPVGETIVFFESDQPRQLQVSLYNRGDDGEILEKAFAELLEFWGAKLGEVTGASGEKRGRDNRSAVRTEGMVWNKGNTVYLLESSAEKRPFQAEFVRLRVGKVVKKGFLEEKLAKEERTVRADLPANVVRKDGDVFIQGIPMVDQGQKGYCVVASTARVFAYYGMQVDQHEIAQIAGSSASGGTSTNSMLDALNDVAGRFKVRVKVHSDLELKTLKDVMENYNRSAKRAGKREIPENLQVYDVTEIYGSFEPEILKEARLKDKPGLKRFKSEIQNSIDLGVPILWSLVLGIYPEEKLNLQSKGGHMRIIIGYNSAKDEVIFSDSWGAGHEMKRVGTEEAFCSTTGLFSVLPIK